MFQATLVVENVHLHILPSMNPDGFTLRRRGNANDVDLNRDFPDQVYHFNSNLYITLETIILKFIVIVKSDSNIRIIVDFIVMTYD